MKELQISLKNPLIIVENFDEVRADLIEGLKDYEIEVTQENLAEAKRMATDLNTLSKVIGQARITKSKEFSIPIAEFQAQAKELEDLAQVSREKILSQVKVFEDKTLLVCGELVTAYLEECWNNLEIRNEYRVSDATGLIKISNLTPGGALTKSARESAQGLAQQDRIAQDRVDGRISKLEAECFKAGLSTPLQAAHVEKWLDESDAIYNANLEKLIRIEVAREAYQKAAIIEQERAKIRAEEQTKAKIEAEAKAKIEREERERAQVEAAEKAKIEREAKTTIEKEKPSTPIEKLAEAIKDVPPGKPASKPTHAKSEADRVTDKIPLIVAVTFGIQATPGYSEDKIKGWFRLHIGEKIIGDLLSITVSE